MSTDQDHEGVPLLPKILIDCPEFASVEDELPWRFVDLRVLDEEPTILIQQVVTMPAASFVERYEARMLDKLRQSDAMEDVLTLDSHSTSWKPHCADGDGLLWGR